MTKGGFKYVPKELLEELNNIKFNCKVNKDADCFRIIARNSKIGRQIKLTFDLNERRK